MNITGSWYFIFYSHCNTSLSQMLGRRYLNYIHKTSFSTTNIAQSTSIKKTKMRVTFKEKRVCGNKMPTRCNRCFLLQILLLAQHVSGTIISIISCSSSQTGHITLSSTPYRQLENKAPNTTDSNHLYNTLELLMMGIMVPETCWASNKICNKYHLLHLAGILFPHINDDARSKSLRKKSNLYWQK